MIDAIIELYGDEEFLIAEGFNDAVIGFDSIGNKLIYSVTKVIDILVSSGLTYEDAVEHFDFNIIGALGDNMPIWCYDNF